MPPLEPWKKVLVEDKFFETPHGQIDCTWCHSGNPYGDDDEDKDEAHEGLIKHPSERADMHCMTCHEKQSDMAKMSIHTTQEGFFERIRLRSGFDWRSPGHEDLYEDFEGECAACHASCGQCHITRPWTSGGGFNKGHVFYKSPDLQTNCTACHGSRVGEAYLGSLEGLKADVHYIPNAKKCQFCHNDHEMHGGDEGVLLTYRYDERTSNVKCEDCHEDSKYSNEYHLQHWVGESGKRHSCFVCHSQPYKNCSGCHAGGHGITGSSYITFEIGRNYLKKTNKRYKDYDYITVRHIPTAANTYEDWGIDDLANFDNAEPTWKYTSPHNILRWTPQTTVEEGQTCNANCHDTDLFLREDDVELYEKANYKEDTGAVGYGYPDAVEREKKVNRDVFIPY